MRIHLAGSDDEIAACFPVMAELRPHLKAATFVETVRKQEKESGFRLAVLDDEGVKAVGGIRIGHWLPRGKALEIEDLVTKSGERSKGYGGGLFDWIIEYAREQECNEVKLVSAVTRFDAHRFYLSKRMKIEAHFFSLLL